MYFATIVGILHWKMLFAVAFFTKTTQQPYYKLLTSQIMAGNVDIPFFLVLHGSTPLDDDVRVCLPAATADAMLL